MNFQTKNDYSYLSRYVTFRTAAKSLLASQRVQWSGLEFQFQIVARAFTGDFRDGWDGWVCIGRYVNGAKI